MFELRSTQTCSSLTCPRPVPDNVTFYGYQTFCEDKLGEEEMSRTVQLKFQEKESENFKFARCQVNNNKKTTTRKQPSDFFQT